MLLVSQLLLLARMNRVVLLLLLTGSGGSALSRTISQLIFLLLLVRRRGSLSAIISNCETHVCWQNAVVKSLSVWPRSSADLVLWSNPACRFPPSGLLDVLLRELDLARARLTGRRWRQLAGVAKLFFTWSLQTIWPVGLWKVSHLWIILKHLLLALVVILVILHSRAITPWLNRSRGSRSRTSRGLDSLGSPSRRLCGSHEVVELHLTSGRKTMAVFNTLGLSVRMFHEFIFTSIAVLNSTLVLGILRTRRSRKIVWRDHLIFLVANPASGNVSGTCALGPHSEDSSILIHFWAFALVDVVILLFQGLSLMKEIKFGRIVDRNLRSRSLRLSLNGVA